jgi:hypothetical protein
MRRRRRARSTMYTPEVKEFVLTKFKGAVLPSW